MLITTKQFMQQHSKEEFLNYCNNHYLDEILAEFNISKDVYHSLRKKYKVSTIKPRLPKRTSEKGTYVFYTDGIHQIRVYNNQAPPDGFVRGRSKFSSDSKKKLSESRKKLNLKTHNKNKVLCNNGESHAYFYSDSIPDGWVKGSLRLGQVAFHNDEGETKYFLPQDDIPQGWVLGESPKSGKLKNEIAWSNRIKNIQKFEVDNDCTQMSKLKKLYPNNWYRSKLFLKELSILKYSGSNFVLNQDIDMIQNYQTDKWRQQNKIIQQFEKTNDCTLLRTLEKRFGQLKLFSELPKLHCGKFNFISNSYYQNIIDYYEISQAKATSHAEKELLSYVRSLYNGEIQENVRTIIINPDTNRGYELDIYMPELHLAIEFNGIHWHSSDCITECNYHTKKSLLCEEKNIQLLHIYQSQWKYNTDKIKSIIQFAINCKMCKDVPPEQCHFDFTVKTKSKATMVISQNDTVLYNITIDNIDSDPHLQIDRLSDTLSSKKSIAIAFDMIVKKFNLCSISSSCDFDTDDGENYKLCGMHCEKILPNIYSVISDKMYHEQCNNSQSVIYASGIKQFLWQRCST